MAAMQDKASEEFRSALLDISVGVTHFTSPYDRVRCCEWARKLAGMPHNDEESCINRNRYIQYLLIFVNSTTLGTPFNHPPPEDDLPPFGEYMGRELRRVIPELPEPGPVSPVIAHSSPDGKASITIKRLPDGGVFCYMAVTPDSF